MTTRLSKAARDPELTASREAFIEAFSTGDFLYPKIAVYRGAGASHSWTWFADLLGRLSLFDVDFIDGAKVIDGLAGYDVLLFGGGDTYEKARALGAAGAAQLERAVESGSLYWGSCAGAYMVLSEVDLEPFTPFSLVPASMKNVIEDPPPPRCMAHKYLAPYGDGWVFNPVYGEVLLNASDGKKLGAPLYGGPVMSAGEGSAVVARYGGELGRASYLWEPPEAMDFIRDSAAVLSNNVGDGVVYAAGPHLEHPMFGKANALIGRELVSFCKNRAARTRAASIPVSHHGTGECERLCAGIKRETSNARIASFGLEKMPLTWTSGVKVWEPAKVSMFLECAWGRLPQLARLSGNAPINELEALERGYAGISVMVKSVVRLASVGEDSRAEALTLLFTLKELTARFLSLYFRLRLDGMPGTRS